jgi:DNA-binding transcriptional MerR regulator
VAIRQSRSVDDTLIAFTETAAMRLVHVSQRQLRYWAETNLVRPSIVASIGPRTKPRLYAFDDLLALLVAAQLRERFSLQHVRRVVTYLGRKGYRHPLSELRFAIEGDQIFFQHTDGSWEGDRRPGQVVLSHVIELEPLRQRIRDTAAAPRERSLRGSTEQRRKVLGSKRVFSGTRTPVEALFPYLKRRYTTEQILEAFPHLSREDVTVARRQFRELGAA